jgi:hypothetical protein
MAATTYEYTISTAFPNAKVNLSRLTKEINDSAIVTDLQDASFNNSVDTCYVVFVDALSAGDKTILDAIVAAHSGEPLPSPIVYGSNYHIVEDETISITTATEFQQKLRLSISDLEAGTYRVGWSFECLGSNKGQFLAQVQVDDTTTLYSTDEELRPSAGWRSASGFGKIALTSGDHFIDLDYCTSLTIGVSKIRRARLELMGIGE